MEEDDQEPLSIAQRCALRRAKRRKPVKDQPAETLKDGVIGKRGRIGKRSGNSKGSKAKR